MSSLKGLNYNSRWCNPRYNIYNDTTLIRVEHDLNSTIITPRDSVDVGSPSPLESLPELFRRGGGVRLSTRFGNKSAPFTLIMAPPPKCIPHITPSHNHPHTCPYNSYEPNTLAAGCIQRIRQLSLGKSQRFLWLWRIFPLSSHSLTKTGKTKKLFG